MGFGWAVSLGVVVALAFPCAAGAGQEEGPVKRYRGEPVVPIYEGWYSKPDGSIQLSFGYLNFNYLEEPDIPVGPNNRIAPGPDDRGQPTHFLPRRHAGVFTVAIPKGTPKTEYRWTLRIRGKVTSVPATLSPLYEIAALKMSGPQTFDNGGIPLQNSPPVLRFDPDGVDGTGPEGARTVRRVGRGEKLVITMRVSDDGLPLRGKNPGRVTLGWSRFRGPGDVTFDPLRTTVRERAGVSSVTATFSKPGEYVLWVLATDGSGFLEQCCWTNGYVAVTVK